jgi:small GTP-binding protein
MARKKLKVVMLGEGRVGKTSLLHRFVHNTFDEECASTTKATMYANTRIEVGETMADVSIWDTAGQERYHALGPIYYRDAHGAVLAYDITDKDSFDKVKVWLKELHQVVGEHISVVVVGNKCDLERERKVSKKEAEEWATAHGAQHFLCSAKLGIRVGDAFTALVTSIVKNSSTSAATSSASFHNGGGGRPAPQPPRSKGVKIAPADDGVGPRETTEKKDCAC